MDDPFNLVREPDLIGNLLRDLLWISEPSSFRKPASETLAVLSVIRVGADPDQSRGWPALTRGLAILQPPFKKACAAGHQDVTVSPGGVVAEGLDEPVEV